MNKNTLLITLAGFVSIASSDAQKINFVGVDNINQKLIHESTYSIPRPSSISLKVDLYCQSTPETLRKRNVYFKRPDNKTYVPFDEEPVVFERLPFEAIRQDDYFLTLANLHKNIAFKYVERNYNNRQKVLSKNLRT